MKTIQQLLFLSKNPYYELRPEEKEVLNDFLKKKQEEEESKNSPRKKSKKSDRTTNVRVRNVVDKTIPSVEESGQ